MELELLLSDTRYVNLKTSKLGLKELGPSYIGDEMQFLNVGSLYDCEVLGKMY